MDSGVQEPQMLRQPRVSEWNGRLIFFSSAYLNVKKYAGSNLVCQWKEPTNAYRDSTGERCNVHSVLLGIGELGDNLVVACDKNVLRRCKQKILWFIAITWSLSHLYDICMAEVRIGGEIDHSCSASYHSATIARSESICSKGSKSHQTILVDQKYLCVFLCYIHHALRKTAFTEYAIDNLIAWKSLVNFCGIINFFF